MRYFLIISSCFLIIFISCSKKSNNPQPTSSNNTNSSGCFYSFSQSVRPYVALVSPDGMDSTYVLNNVFYDRDSLIAPFPITLFGYSSNYLAYPMSGIDLEVNDSSDLLINVLDPLYAQNEKKYLSWKTFGTAPNRIFVTQIQETFPSEYNIQYSFFENADSVTVQYGENIGGFDGGGISMIYSNGYSMAYGNLIYGSLSNLKDTCINLPNFTAYNAFINDTTGSSNLVLSVPNNATITTGTTFTFKKLK